MANASILAAFERMWKHIVNALSTKVSFTEEQSLTDEQKAQARENIGIDSLSQPDWNQNDDTAADYIKNRPFYAGDLVETELVDVNTATLAQGDRWNQVEQIDDTSYLWGSYPLVTEQTLKEGKEYIAIINGKQYNSISTLIEDMGCIAFGDVDEIVMGSETIPDSFRYACMEFTSRGYIQILYKGENAPTEFRIIEKEQEIVKIDPKYLPDDIGGNVVVDSELSAESENPVQNKVVNEAISNLNNLVGDTAVSEQIEAAIEKIPAVEVPVTSVNGMVGDVVIDIPEVNYPVTSVNGQTGDVVIEIPEQVQSDWNQNDETSKDFIKNRTHYISSMNAISWNGNTSDKECLIELLYKVEGQSKANILTDAVLRNSVIYIYQKYNGEETYTPILASEEGFGFVTIGDVSLIGEHVLVVRKDNAVFNGLQIQNAGVYFMHQENGEDVIYVSGLFYPDDVKTLDDIYIPETVVRHNDIYHYTKGNLIYDGNVTTNKQTDSATIAFGEIGTDFTSSLVLGNWYVIDFNGVEYVCKYLTNPYGAGSQYSSYYLGNMYMQHYGNWILNGKTEEEVIELLEALGLQDTGEPFNINSTLSVYTKEAGTHIINIYEANITKIDEKYIPDNIARIENVIQTPTTATVGQTIMVKAIDENGKPTEWEAVDLPSVVMSATTYTDQSTGENYKIYISNGELVIEKIDENGQVSYGLPTAEEASF